MELDSQDENISNLHKIQLPIYFYKTLIVLVADQGAVRVGRLEIFKKNPCLLAAPVINDNKIMIKTCIFLKGDKTIPGKIKLIPYRYYYITG